MMAIDVKVKAAGLMMIALPLSIASWIQSTSSYSRLDCLNTIGQSGLASRHIASTWAMVVEP